MLEPRFTVTSIILIFLQTGGGTGSKFCDIWCKKTSLYQDQVKRGTLSV